MVAKAARTLLLPALALIAAVVPGAASATHPSPAPRPTLLVAGLAGGSGSVVGPDGALYVTERTVGRVSRVDPRTGRVTTFASGLPPAVVPVLGAMDIAFIGRTAYVLVSGVAADVGGDDVVGIYRVDGPQRFTVVADIGAWATTHPPPPPFFVPTGTQYSLQPYRGGFVVTDAHHNRVLQVGLDGTISVVIQFGNLVPTGLEVRGKTIYVTQAGPVPHLPENGKVLKIAPRSGTATEIASGGRLLVDVELGKGGTLFALAQGFFVPGHPEGSPAEPNTGRLLRVGKHGTLTSVADGLNQPTSLEIIGRTGYVVTLGGEIWKIEGI
jgi:sugar lactone lactonase YvrE